MVGVALVFYTPSWFDKDQAKASKRTVSELHREFHALECVLCAV